MVSGEVKIVGSDNLGGLGARDGPPVLHTWTRASLMPLLLPWLAMLALLMYKPNRSAQAWWIWLALGVVCGLNLGLSALFGFIPSEPRDFISQTVIATAFGWGALWLLAPSLGNRYRLFTALGMFVIVAGFSLFTYLARGDWGADSGLGVMLVVPLVLMAFVLVLGLSLASLACRRRFTAIRLLLYLTGWVLVGWTVILLSLIVPTLLLSSGRVPWMELCLAVFICTGVGLVIALPFLILSFAHPFFGARLMHLLHVPAAQVPQVLAAPDIPSPTA
jgi:hypothetical protein